MTVRGSAYTRRQRAAMLLLAGVLPLLIGLGGAVIIGSWAPELPEQVASHWGGSGQPDGYSTVWGVVITIAAVSVLLAGIFAAAVLSLTDDASPSRGRILAGASILVSTAITVAIVGAIGQQRQPATGQGSDDVGRWLLAGLGAGVVLGVVAFLVAPRSVHVDRDNVVEPDPIELSPEERAVWTGVATPSRHFVLLYGGVIALAVGASIAAATQDPLAVVVAVVPVLLVLSATVLRWRVTVSRAGLRATGLFGVPRFVIPLAEIESVRVARVDAFSEFGGWGLRWGAGRTGIILRSGDSIEVRRTHGRALVVTIADAQTGVALLSGFLARAARPR